MNRPAVQPVLSFATVIAAAPDQVHCELHDEAVILNISDGEYYGLNPVAARVWELIQQPRSLRDVRDAILKEFEVGEEECTDHLIELLSELKRCKLIVLSNGGAA